MNIEYFDTKNIEWLDIKGDSQKHTILLQNKNGPCPLVALVNTLVLSGHKIGSFTQGKGTISVKGLLDYLGEVLADNLHGSSTSEIDFETAFALLPQLITGLNINPRFDGTFEEGPEMSIFRLFDTDIVHGWVCDPKSSYYDAMMAVGSYDQSQSLLLRVSEQGSSVTEEDNDRAAAVRLFTEEYASQLTPYGIEFVKDLINPSQPCIFFRNNHFATLYKRGQDLYVLVADSGLRYEPRITWQGLSDVSGSSDMFYNGSFEAQYDLEQISGATEGEIQPHQDEDYKLAKKLQMQEDSKMATSMSRRKESKNRNTKTKKDSKNCIVM